jgi:hypothetical protein
MSVAVVRVSQPFLDASHFPVPGPPATWRPYG